MNLSFHGLAAVLSIAAVPAFAAPSQQPIDQRIVITAPATTATPLKGAALMHALSDVGHFAMSDGERLRLVPRGSQLRMSYAGRAPVTLRPDGAGGYASSDGRFSLQASVGDGGDTRVRLTRPLSLD